MKTIFLAFTILAFIAPAMAAEQAQTRFWLTQDTGTMKCQIVEIQPATGSNIKVIGSVHSTRALATAAMTANHTCSK